MKPMKLTRRKLAGAILVPAAALSQNPPAPPAAPADELKAARDRLAATGETLARQSVPMDIEPAFQFKP
jgi:hypothetical protein